MSVFKNFLIGLNQTLNCLIRLNGEYGTPDEMFSARAWRLRATHPKLHVWVDRLFFWDKDHCQEIYEMERRREQLNDEYRKFGRGG